MVKINIIYRARIHGYRKWRNYKKRYYINKNNYLIFYSGEEGKTYCFAEKEINSTPSSEDMHISAHYLNLNYPTNEFRVFVKQNA